MRSLARSRLVIYGLLAALVFPSVLVAHPFFGRWWTKPPADPVLDVTFAPVSVAHASLCQFTIASNRVQSRTWTSLTGVATTATVATGQITIAPVTLTDTAATTTVTVTLDAAPLSLNYFGSSFRTTGTASAVVGTTTVSVPVWVCGQVNTVNGQYQLRANVSGTGYTGTGPYTVSFLHFDLTGSVAVPTPPAP